MPSSCVCPSVCLCVCLSHSGIVSQRLNVESRKWCHTIGFSIEMFRSCRISTHKCLARSLCNSRATCDTIPECDRQTHRHTTTAYTALSIVSRGKKLAVYEWSWHTPKVTTFAAIKWPYYISLYLSDHFQNTATSKVNMTACDLANSFIFHNET